MKHAKILSAFLLLLVITLSLVTLVNPKATIASDVSTPFLSNSVIQKISFGNQNAVYLNQTTRVQIYDFVTNNPGTNFRGICNALMLPIGVVQYHLALLMKGDLVSKWKDGRNKRFFRSNKFSGLEMKIISVLRHDTARKILEILHKHKSESHGKLAKRLGISSQALTWQMKQLKDAGLLYCEADGLTVRYSLDETLSETICQCLTLTQG